MCRMFLREGSRQWEDLNLLLSQQTGLSVFGSLWTLIKMSLWGWGLGGVLKNNKNKCHSLSHSLCVPLLPHPFHLYPLPTLSRETGWNSSKQLCTHYMPGSVLHILHKNLIWPPRKNKHLYFTDEKTEALRGRSRSLNRTPDISDPTDQLPCSPHTFISVSLQFNHDAFSRAYVLSNTLDHSLHKHTYASPCVLKFSLEKKTLFESSPSSRNSPIIPCLVLLLLFSLVSFDFLFQPYF